MQVGPGLIPGSGSSPEEGTGYPLQYSWASIVAKLVKSPPAMRETWIPSLGWEDPPEKGTATLSSVLAWRISPWSCKEFDTTERLSLFTNYIPINVALVFLFLLILSNTFYKN